MCKCFGGRVRIQNDPDGDKIRRNRIKFSVDKCKVIELIRKIQQQKQKVENDRWRSFLVKDQIVIMDYTLSTSQ